MQRSVKDSPSAKNVTKGSNGSEKEVWVQKRRNSVTIADTDEDVAFIQALERTEKQRVEMEEIKLQLAYLQLQAEIEKRKRAREERNEKMEEAAQLVVISTTYNL